MRLALTAAARKSLLPQLQLDCVTVGVQMVPFLLLLLLLLQLRCLLYVMATFASHMPCSFRPRSCYCFKSCLYPLH